MSLSRFPLHPCCCIQMRLCRAGDPPSGSDDCGRVAPRRVFSPYHRAGDERRCSGSGRFSAPVVGPECRPDEQQHLGCRLSPKSGRLGLSRVVLHGCRGSLVLWTECHTVPLSARYIPGRKNVLAGQLSRPNQVLPMEWSL